MNVALRAHALMLELHACSYLFLVKKKKVCMSLVVILLTQI